MMPASVVGSVTTTPRTPMTGLFLVLEGPDGAGKTTLASLLAARTYEAAVATLGNDAQPVGQAAGQSLVFVPRRQISAASEYAAGLMKQLATMLWHSGDAPDLPDSFWVGLQAAWFSAHSVAVLGPLLEAGYDVITDGWIYKFCSKLLLQGYSQPDLDVIFGRVRKPDAVILLAADLEEIYDRRRDFRPAELGMHAAYQKLGRASFIDYQRAALERLLSYAAANPRWRVVTLDPLEAPAESAGRLTSLIADLRMPANLGDAPAEATS